MNRFILVACIFLARQAYSEAFKPYHVISLSGTASLSRFEDETWPLEAGQDLPGDITLSLEPGAFIHLRIWRRLDLALAGPAMLRAFSLEKEVGGEQSVELVFRVERGDLFVDPRFLLGRPARLNLDLPDASFDLAGTRPFLISAEAGRATEYALTPPVGPGPAKEWDAAAGLPASQGPVAARRVDGALVPAGPAPRPARPWPAVLLDLASRPMPVLVLGRDFDKEREKWGRPARLGPALVEALEDLPGLNLVEGSGDTTLAAYANHAIRSGLDFFLQELALERGARWIVVGNNVVEELRDGSPQLRNRPLISAQAEVRVIEAHRGGEVLVSDNAATLTARAGRDLESAGGLALEASAARVAGFIRGDIENLLKGEPHAPRLVKAVFNNVSEARQREIRRALASMDSVQRYFKRGFASGVYNVDLVLRKKDEDFLAQILAWPFESFSLERDAEAGLAFTLRPIAPTPVPTPKRPKDWRR